VNGRKFDYSVLELHRLWASGASYDEIAAALGCGASLVCRLKVRHKLPDRPRKGVKGDRDPTPQEIAERARECRERHYARRRSETPTQTDTRLSHERARARA